jgi:hypothetical protein
MYEQRKVDFCLVWNIVPIVQVIIGGWIYFIPIVQTIFCTHGEAIVEDMDAL